MKKQLLFSLLLGTSTTAFAGYEFIPYYDNNPFLFCTIGVPQDCWAPVDPTIGAFTVTNYQCFSPYSAHLFARVCPQAFPHGVVTTSMRSRKSMPHRG